MSKFTHAHGVDMVATLKHGVDNDTNPGVYIHGVNCQGVAKSGIAGQLVKAFPGAFDIYCNVVRQNKEEGFRSSKLLGGSVSWILSPSHILVHCFTQDGYGRNPEVIYADYLAIRSCMRDMSWRVPAIKRLGLHYPMIGAGLANGDWDIIHQIIEEEIPPTVHRTLYTLD